MKKIFIPLLILVLVVAALSLTACSLFGQESNDTPVLMEDDIHTVYTAYAESGGTLSYEDWLAAIKGEKGDPGEKGEEGVAGVGIRKIEKSGTEGLVDTYTITLTDGTTYDFTVTNGAAGEKGDQGDKGGQGDKGDSGNGISKVEKGGTEGLVDTYTITFDDGTTYDFTVKNGKDGQDGASSFADPDVTPDEYFRFTLKREDGYSVSARYKDMPAKTVIPKYYNGKLVKYIDRNGFYDVSSMDVIVIPDSICEIGEDAFLMCYDGLTVDYLGEVVDWFEIDMEEGAELSPFGPHYMSIKGEPLTELVVPEDVEEILSEQFAYNLGLRSIFIPEGVRYIEEGAFYECDDLSEVTISEYNHVIKPSDFQGTPYYNEYLRNSVIRIRGLLGYEDDSTAYLEEMFDVDLDISTYEYSVWTNQVNSDIFSSNLPDVFQADVNLLNKNNTYDYWVDGEIVKALPSDLSRWPRLKALLESIEDLDHWKKDGKLYGIPVVRNTNVDDVTPFAPYAYVYRRDVAKELGVYQENDVYSWTEFIELLKAFRTRFSEGTLADASFAFPSIVDFFSSGSGAFAYAEDGTIINRYTTAGYLEGLNNAKQLIDQGIYTRRQFNNLFDSSNLAYRDYQREYVGVIYDNITYANYKTYLSEINDADKLAFMKVMGPDGKFVAQEQSQWWSMSLFSASISDTKMEKILDIFEYLLSEEGERLAVYGLEGSDYEIIDGEIVLSEHFGDNGEKGVRGLRYLLSLGEELLSYDLSMEADASYKGYVDFMQEKNECGDLRIQSVGESVYWTEIEHGYYLDSLLARAEDEVWRYLLGNITKDEYLARVDSDTAKTLFAEINAALSA